MSHVNVIVLRIKEFPDPGTEYKNGSLCELSFGSEYMTCAYTFKFFKYVSPI